MSKIQHLQILNESSYFSKNPLTSIKSLSASKLIRNPFTGQTVLKTTNNGTFIGKSISASSFPKAKILSSVQKNNNNAPAWFDHR